jgi:hypothetical protein
MRGADAEFAVATLHAIPPIDGHAWRSNGDCRCSDPSGIWTVNPAIA